MTATTGMLPPETIPNDHSRQVTAPWYVDHLHRRGLAPRHVLDVGCGEGGSVDLFRGRFPGARWVGVDIEDSGEVLRRTRTDAEFHAFDGVHLPFDDGAFDLVYCRQVFEHVRHPEPLLAQIRRVMAPGGHLVLSASYLETYHSRSLWGYTPYGFHELLKSAGIELVEMRPGVDGMALFLRRVLGRPRFADRWIEGESPLNRAIGLYGRLRKRPHTWINERKLLFCGHFCLLARRAPLSRQG